MAYLWIFFDPLLQYADHLVLLLLLGQVQLSSALLVLTLACPPPEQESDGVWVALVAGYVQGGVSVLVMVTNTSTML